MRLADFILANIEPILGEWEAFARGIWPGAAATDPATLRDDAEEMLRAAAADMKSDQTAAQQSDKSKGKVGEGPESAGVARASVSHGVSRVADGFDLASLIAEYRALRASVIRLWRESRPAPHTHDLADLTRFNESIDQSLTGAVLAHTDLIDRDRQMILGELQRRARELREVNEALVVSSVRQHELNEQAQRGEMASAKLAAIVESSDDAIISKDLDGVITSWNKGAQRLFGYSAKEAIGKPVTLLIPEDHLDEEPMILERIRRGESVDHYETVRRRKDGMFLDISLTVSPMRDEAGKVVGASKVARDITGQKRAEEALRQSEQRYRTLVEQVKDYAIFSTDVQGRATTWNQGVKKVLGFEEGEFIGQDITRTIFTPEDVAQGVPEQELEEAARTGTAGNDRWMRRKNGERFFANGVTTALRSDDQLVGFTKVMRDQTERESFERERAALLANEQAARMEAEAANRAKDMFLATLSHEMRTPLSAIVGWMTILRSDDCAEADLQEGLEVIERNTKAQVQLIEDVLDVSRIVSGKLRLEIRPCDLIEVIKAGIDAVRPAAEARDITLEVALDPAASTGSCDPARIQQVVWNLVSNAVKFTPRGGAVRVTLARGRSTLRIQVSDTGQGISPELLPFIFDRFRQADSSTRRRFGGLGLGLSIVKHLVELHGGTVQAHSAGAGQGATFTVLLPIRSARIDADLMEPSERRVGSQLTQRRSAYGGAAGGGDLALVRLDGLRVLVVDDEADARRLLVRVLGEVGATVTDAAGADEALAAIERHPPEILVSDLGMPDHDGFDLIREVRKRGHHPRDLPAVALTAFVHKNDARDALLAGFQVHVPKPVDAHDLTAVLASLAGRTGRH